MPIEYSTRLSHTVHVLLFKRQHACVPFCVVCFACAGRWQRCSRLCTSLLCFQKRVLIAEEIQFILLQNYTCIDVLNGIAMYLRLGNAKSVGMF